MAHTYVHMYVYVYAYVWIQYYINCIEHQLYIQYNIYVVHMLCRIHVKWSGIYTSTVVRIVHITMYIAVGGYSTKPVAVMHMVLYYYLNISCTEGSLLLLHTAINPDMLVSCCLDFRLFSGDVFIDAVLDGEGTHLFPLLHLKVTYSRLHCIHQNRQTKYSSALKTVPHCTNPY